MGVPPGSFDSPDQLVDQPDTFTAQAEAAFESEQISPQVSFSLQGVQPPSNLYVTIDDQLQLLLISVRAGITVQVSYRLLRSDGQIIVANQAVSTNGNVTLQFTNIQLAEGYILGVTVEATSGPVKRGEIYARIGLITSAQSGVIQQTCLASEYLVTGFQVAWPGGPTRSPVDGLGLCTVQNPNVPLGTEISFTVPPGLRWRIMSLSFQLTTSGQTGNRTPVVRIIPAGTQVSWLIGDGVAIPPVTVAQYYVGSAGFAPLNIGSAHYLPLPDYITLGQGDQINTLTSGIQSGDLYNLTAFQFEQWIE